MMIDGKQRAASTVTANSQKPLALHLLDDRHNEAAEVIEISGVANTQDLYAALLEMDDRAELRPTRYPLYHININPHPNERNLTPGEWGIAVDTLEEALGFTNQPRAVVRHVKNGREHTHVVWSLIAKRKDGNGYKILPYGNNYKKHQRVARQLAKRFGLKAQYHPACHEPGDKRPPRRISKNLLHQAARTGISIEATKAAMQAAWKASNGATPLAAALAAQGLILARGDRRDFVVVDTAGGVHSIPRLLGLKTAEVRARLAGVKADELPTTAEAQGEAGTGVPVPANANAPLSTRAHQQWQKLRELTMRQKAERKSLWQKQRQQQKSRLRILSFARTTSRNSARKRLWEEQKKRQAALWQIHKLELEALSRNRRSIARAAWIKDRQIERNVVVLAWRALTGNRSYLFRMTRADTNAAFAVLKNKQTIERQTLATYHKAVRESSLAAIDQQFGKLIKTEMAAQKSTHTEERKTLSLRHTQEFQSQLQAAKSASAAAQRAAGEEQFATTKARLQAMVPKPIVATPPQVLPNPFRANTGVMPIEKRADHRSFASPVSSARLKHNHFHPKGAPK